MAASVHDLKFFLQNHKITQIIQENATKEPTNSPLHDAKELIVVDGNSLFVWNAYDACILHCSLVSASHRDHVQSEDQVRDDPVQGRGACGASNCETANYQRLTCSNVPTFDIDHVSLSPTSAFIALSGQNGVTVIVVPSRKSRFGEFDDGKECVICRSVSVGEDELARRDKTRVLHTAWHPGGETGSHLAVLFSTSLICVYDVLRHDNCVQTISLSDGDPNTDLHTSVFDTALGEVAVSFDFGAQIYLSRRGKRVSESMAEGDCHPIWPIYVLKGNGDVLIAYSDLSYQRQIAIPTTSPLMMYPPAEDNYGTDACSIVCLPTVPETLAIATCAGSLYHCVVLAAHEGDTQTNQSFLASHIDSPSVSGYNLPKQMSLYVYEVVELEFSLVSSPREGEIIDEFNYPIRLMKGSFNVYRRHRFVFIESSGRIHKHVYTPDRYHCCHSAGVHTVAVSWVQSLQKYSLTEKDSSTFSLDQSSIVEHLICTKPLISSPNAPIMGVAAVSYHNIGVWLLALTSEMTFELLPLSSRYHVPEMPLLSESPRRSVVDSPLKRLRNEPFHQHIEKILRRNASNPIIRSSSHHNPSQQECFELLTRATHFFREEYILKQGLAREKIEKRIRILQDQKRQQENDVTLLEDSRTTLRDSAERIAEKLEDTKVMQTETLDRIRVVMRHIQSQVPGLSAAEEKLHQDLSEMSDRLDIYTSQLKHVQTKYEHQQRQAEQLSLADSSPSAINPKQTQGLKTVLKQQSDDIADLVKSVNRLKVNVNL